MVDQLMLKRKVPHLQRRNFGLLSQVEAFQCIKNYKNQLNKTDENNYFMNYQCFKVTVHTCADLFLQNYINYPFILNIVGADYDPSCCVTPLI